MMSCRDCKVECYDSCEINVRERSERIKLKELKIEKIQMTEFEFTQIIRDCYPVVETDDTLIKSMVQGAKAHGYIRKSALEEAEEQILMFKSTKIDGPTHVSVKSFEILVEAIQELKLEIERLKK